MSLAWVELIQTIAVAVVAYVLLTALALFFKAEAAGRQAPPESPAS
ncbi:MAG TPA: hypothetical protein PLT37_03930 [Kiritimatiellia bacterium]|jgi:ABC-type phosphate/phosphonate transport system permease subunit|nr:hypothetical protein [Kiritimatiellia bacterium]HQF20380.1 hypothetical protein [Kiritimatiellia bacterium]HQG74281.1 hypothetical protein [Kiritimatiellia bacterium]